MISEDEEIVAYLPCSCTDPAHLVIATLWTPGDHDPIVYLHYQLNPLLGFWGRLRAAVRYLLNRPMRNASHWDETLLEGDRIAQLEQITARYRAAEAARRPPPPAEPQV